MTKQFEVFVTEDNANLIDSNEFPMMCCWSEVFDTPSERADYILDIIAQTEKFNSNPMNELPVIISFIKVDNTHFTESVRISEVSS